MVLTLYHHHPRPWEDSNSNSSSLHIMHCNNVRRPRTMPHSLHLCPLTVNQGILCSLRSIIRARCPCLQDSHLANRINSTPSLMDGSKIVDSFAFLCVSRWTFFTFLVRTFIL